MNNREKGPAVYIAPGAQQRIRHWVAMARGEVSGLGTVIPRSTDLLIQEAFLLEQTCSSAHTALDDEAIARLLMEIDGHGLDISTVRFWWHSHGTMQSYWSGTDDDCIEGLANDAFAVSLVTNKHGHDRARLDLFQPVRLTIDQLTVSLYADDLQLYDLCAAEFAEKVDERPTILRHGGGPTRSIHGARQSPPLLPPWPCSDQLDSGTLIDLDDEWTDDWELGGDDQLALQLDDPWHAALRLEAR